FCACSAFWRYDWRVRIVALLGILATVLGAQSKPDYNGVWVANFPKNKKPIDQGTTGGHLPLTIAVTDTDATVVAHVTGPNGEDVVPPPGGFTEVTSVCNFGSTPYENSRRMRPVMCLAKREGDSLVLSFTTKAMGSYPGSASTDTYSLDGP